MSHYNRMDEPFMLEMARTVARMIEHDVRAGENRSLYEIYDLVGVCRVTISPRFQHLYGVTPKHYRSRFRMLYAAKLIRKHRTRGSITKAADDMGISCSTLSRRFHEATGIYPIEFANSSDERASEVIAGMLKSICFQSMQDELEANK